MGRFPLVHALGTALVNHTLGVANHTVVVFGAHRLEQLNTSNARRACPIQYDFYVLD